MATGSSHLPLRDANAELQEDKQRGQLNAGLTSIAGTLESAKTTEFSWLDVGCGKGQVLAQVRDHFADTSRAKIDYVGVDFNRQHFRDLYRVASPLQFKRIRLRCGNVEQLLQVLPPAVQFDFVTLTNTVHELRPYSVTSLLIDCISLLAPTGVFYVYDMEQLDPDKLELGALTWRRPEIQQVLDAMFSSLGVRGYDCSAKRWQHRELDGWFFLVHRENLGQNQLTDKAIDAAKKETAEKLTQILSQRLTVCEAALESLTAGHGRRLGEEEEQVPQRLFELWALHRALKDVER